MAFNFPSAPVVGQEYTSGSVTYIWNGYGWMAEPIPDFVNVEGDTMTGALTIRLAGNFGHLILDQPVVTDTLPVLFKKNNLNRWGVVMTAGPEPGGNANSDFTLRRHADDGSLLGDIPFRINRATGRCVIGQAPVDPSDVATKAYVDATFGGGGPGYLPLTGGTLTGELILPLLTVNAPVGQQADISAKLDSSQRWIVRMTDNFELHRYSNAGGFLGTPFTINRLTGAAAFANALTVTGAFTGAGFTLGTGSIANLTAPAANITNLTSSGTFSLTTVACNALTANAITDLGTLTVSGTSYLQAVNCVGVTSTAVISTTTEYRANRGDNLIVFRAYAAAGGVVRFNNVGGIIPDYGFICKPGVLAGAGANWFNIHLSAGQPHLWIDATDYGVIMMTSDYRTKKDVAPLPSMWAKVKALNPISYTHQDYTPYGAENPLITADDVERWGFKAHELQDTLVKSAASAEKDAPNAIQSPNPWPVIAALTKALQEAMQRVELLERRLGMGR